MLRKCYGVLFVCVLLAVNFGCATAPPKPTELTAPAPIPDNSGAYMCPYTQDGVVAPWCDKAVNASAGATVGKVAGAYAGSKLLEQVPFVGGFLGAKAGEAGGRAIAIQGCGGMEYIKETSDMSFNSVDDLAVWMYVTQSENEHYQQVWKATNSIYPEFGKNFNKALYNAAKQ